MAVIEHPERYSWWMNELDSLGVSTLEKNGINDNREASDLTDAVKQTLYEEYLHQAYSGEIFAVAAVVEDSNSRRDV
jgi:hypothetical protein